jgi:toxin secretion/phage lysis holin
MSKLKGREKGLKQNLLTVILGAVGSFFSFAFGSWDALMMYLLLFMVIDYFTGITRGIVKKELTHKISYIGLAKKVGILVIVAVAHGLDQLLVTMETSIFNTQFPAIRTIVIWGYIINEVTSILENIKQIGVPIPPILEKVLSILKDENDDKQQSNLKVRKGFWQKTNKK